MWRKLGKITLAAVLAYVIALGALACDSGPAGDNTLPPVEVREYEGEDLSSTFTPGRSRDCPHLSIEKNSESFTLHREERLWQREVSMRLKWHSNSLMLLRENWS